MISSINNSPSFSGVVPVRVFVDGSEKFDPKVIKSSCRQLTTLLSKPSKQQGQRISTLFGDEIIKPKEDIIKDRFALFDLDYRASRSKLPFARPSDFFRCVIDRGRAYIVTGPQAALIESYGKALGLAKADCRARQVSNSADLIVANRNYGSVIDDILSSARLRLKDGVDKLLTLNINMKSNGKKEGLSTYKTAVDSITFTT